MRATAPIGAPVGWTFCSGIGAPEMAAPWVDWRLASEIEEFPRAVLSHRFGYQTPENHNQGEPLLWGDMTEITPELARSRGIPLPDLLVAGTPCQAFSIAGLRKGTADARGNLTLKFVETCHAIVDARSDGKLAVLWENVPGVLSDKGNAFGCFLGGLIGSMDPLFPSEKPVDGKSTQFWRWIKAGSVEIENEDGEPSGEFETVDAHHRCRWPSEGMVQGPRARAAWSVLDGQWFGVAQRRRRVFVVVDFGNCIDPAAVLLEPDRLRGDSPPRRKAGQGAAAGTIRSTDGGSDVDHAIANHLVSARMTAIGEYADDDTASSLKARDYKDATDLVAHTLRNEGFDASDGADLISKVDPHDAIAWSNELTVNIELAGAIQRGGDGGRHDGVFHNWAVRRLTPTECARLQGFPDNHCRIPWRGKSRSVCPDGPQYKALGNSMAVPCIAWLLSRMRISAGWAT